MAAGEKKHPDHFVVFLLVVVSLESAVHKIFFAVWFEYEVMDWCQGVSDKVVWKMSSNSDRCYCKYIYF
jgi:hypothetical protein